LNGIGVGLAEAVGAFVLVFGVSAVANGKVGESASGLVVGSSLLLGAMLAGSVSADSYGLINPAVAAGAGVFFAWMHILGPIAGGIVGAWTYKLLAK